MIGERDTSKNTAAWQGCRVLHHPFSHSRAGSSCPPKPPSSSAAAASQTLLTPGRAVPQAQRCEHRAERWQQAGTVGQDLVCARAGRNRAGSAVENPEK